MRLKSTGCIKSCQNRSGILDDVVDSRSQALSLAKNKTDVIQIWMEKYRFGQLSSHTWRSWPIYDNSRQSAVKHKPFIRTEAKDYLLCVGYQQFQSQGRLPLSYKIDSNRVNGNFLLLTVENTFHLQTCLVLYIYVLIRIKSLKQHTLVSWMKISRNIGYKFTWFQLFRIRGAYHATYVEYYISVFYVNELYSVTAGIWENEMTKSLHILICCIISVIT